MCTWSVIVLYICMQILMSAMLGMEVVSMSALTLWVHMDAAVTTDTALGEMNITVKVCMHALKSKSPCGGLYSS